MKIKIINTQKALSPTQISLADYVINPYRGCEFNCLYCYSRENKNIKKDGLTKYLGIKINIAAQLEKELKYTSPRRVLLGSTTECFQYQELKYNLTGKILDILTRHKIPYTILTKSHLIKKYLPQIAENKQNKIYFTLNCAADKIIRLLEEKTPTIKERLDVIEEINRCGIAQRIHIGPFIPHLSSIEEILQKIPEKIKEIDIELYHHKMGNFTEISNRVEQHRGGNVKGKLQEVYLNEKKYRKFAADLKDEIKNLCRKAQYQFKVFYIVPDFNEFYNSSINYENTLII